MVAVYQAALHPAACAIVGVHFVSWLTVFGLKVVMDKIDDIRVTELNDSAYIKPKQLFFKQVRSARS